MTLADTVRNMLAAGCSAQQIADFVIRYDEGRRERVRATNTDRQRDHRARNACHGVTERDTALHGVTERDPRAGALVLELVSNIPPSDTSYPQTPKPPAEKRAQRLSEDFQPDRIDFEVGAENGLTAADVSGWLLTEFRDYWLSEAGQRARKLDWHKTFRNRMRDVGRRRSARAGPNGRETMGSVYMDILNAANGRDENELFSDITPSSFPARTSG